MELCRGPSLAGYLQDHTTNRKLPEQTIQKIALHVASGLKKLKDERNIIHRDLKPGNILIQVPPAATKQIRASEITFKLTDFGFAKIIEAGSKASTICGSPAYMAPELFEEIPYGFAVDMWSLGVILYECLTGKYPFEYDQQQANAYDMVRSYYRRNKILNFTKSDLGSEELDSLFSGLIKRTSTERMTVEEILDHPFLKKEF